MKRIVLGILTLVLLTATMASVSAWNFFGIFDGGTGETNNVVDRTQLREELTREARTETLARSGRTQGFQEFDPSERLVMARDLAGSDLPLYVIEEKLEKLNIDYEDPSADIPEEVFAEEEGTEYETYIQEGYIHLPLQDVKKVVYSPGYYDGPSLYFEVRPLEQQFFDFDKESYPAAKAYVTSMRLRFSSIDDARDAYELIRQSKEDMDLVKGFAPIRVYVVTRSTCLIERQAQYSIEFKCVSDQDESNRFTLQQILTLA